MSELWNRVSAALRIELGDDDWSRYIRPLRTWLHGEVLYLWVDRGDRDWRALEVEAERYDTELRAAFQQLWGRRLREVRYLLHPPKRETVVNDRRQREHRVRARRREDEAHSRRETVRREEYHRLKDEMRELYRSGSLPSLPRTEAALMQWIRRELDGRVERRLATEEAARASRWLGSR